MQCATVESLKSLKNAVLEVNWMEIQPHLSRVAWFHIEAHGNVFDLPRAVLQVPVGPGITTLVSGSGDTEALQRAANDVYDNTPLRFK